jgi:hypothetical protein
VALRNGGHILARPLQYLIANGIGKVGKAGKYVHMP